MQQRSAAERAFELAKRFPSLRYKDIRKGIDAAFAFKAAGLKFTLPEMATLTPAGRQMARDFIFLHQRVRRSDLSRFLRELDRLDAAYVPPYEPWTRSPEAFRAYRPSAPHGVFIIAEWRQKR